LQERQQRMLSRIPDTWSISFEESLDPGIAAFAATATDADANITFRFMSRPNRVFVVLSVTMGRRHNRVPAAAVCFDVSTRRGGCCDRQARACPVVVALFFFVVSPH
jgi:hypothetical protein